MTTSYDQVVPKYKPTVSDKIQRVLYRLEQGEQLGRRDLYDGNKFCVLGMFADESGAGNWVIDSHSEKAVGRFRYRYMMHHAEFSGSAALLPNYVQKLYGFKTDTGLFMLADLSDDLSKKINEIYWKAEFNSVDVKDELICWSMACLNDAGLLVDSGSINQVLADVIRSGAVFA